MMRNDRWEQMGLDERQNPPLGTWHETIPAELYGEYVVIDVEISENEITGIEIVRSNDGRKERIEPQDEDWAPLVDIVSKALPNCTWHRRNE